MKPVRILWLVLGFICLALGTIGIVLPLLPTVPFYLATLFCFAKGSQRMHDWFVGTNLYKRNLESFVKKRGMTMKTKISVLTSITLVMGFGFYMMDKVPIARVVLAIVWAFHVLYFFFRVKTLPDDAENVNEIVTVETKEEDKEKAD